ncbi:hypothetical protein OPV22_001407 [Ensete ventricosum]|uniref:Uncharacterized protein n=1 Tax=Ensete ventricosum TaxID=4639 RepID=A0AAV8RW87_ENSVE|nr:hypothetical protein OPV22_001407 [Ensete ventricosum]
MLLLRLSNALETSESGAAYPLPADVSTTPSFHRCLFRGVGVGSPVAGEAGDTELPLKRWWPPQHPDDFLRRLSCSLESLGQRNPRSRLQPPNPTVSLFPVVLRAVIVADVVDLRPSRAIRVIRETYEEVITRGLLESSDENIISFFYLY